MPSLTQYIALGSDFDGLVPNALLTSGGLFIIPPSGSALTQARIKKLQFKTLGAVGSWIWAQRLSTTGFLAYDVLVAAFNDGATLTGALSGNTGLVLSDVVGVPGEGVITLGDLTGPFRNNEQVTDSGGGDATANGVVTFDSVEIDDGVATDYELAFADDEGLVPTDPNGAQPGTPCPILFTTLGLTVAAYAMLEFDYVPIDGNA